MPLQHLEAGPTILLSLSCHNLFVAPSLLSTDPRANEFYTCYTWSMINWLIVTLYFLGGIRWWLHQLFLTKGALLKHQYINQTEWYQLSLMVSSFSLSYWISRETSTSKISSSKCHQKYQIVGHWHLSRGCLVLLNL